MTSSGSTAGYSATARLLHWLTAALVLTMLPIGIIMLNFKFGDPLDSVLYDFHRSLGIVLIPIVLIRVLYRLTHPAPPLPADLPAIQQFAAHATHWALYAILIVQPFVGWIATSAYPAPITVFWLFEVPSIWPEDRTLSDRLFVLHRWLGIALAGLISAHIGAALFHHFVRKDDILLRMIGR
jgi:cytochrome b561